MIARTRLMVLLARPAVILLLGLFAATGLAQAGRGQDPVLLAKALAVVIGFLLCAVACNDLADEAIDRVNLPHDPRRPLVAGTANRRELVTVAVSAAAVALAASVTLGWPATLVTAAGLILSSAYSLHPVRLAERGALASLMLPACYVAVPFLLGVFAVRDSVRPADLALLAGLYVAFIGRILLKDFRDVRGDALFGKRTFLVRHGRRRTCLVSAGCWVLGSVAIVTAVHRPSAALLGAYAVCLVAALLLLRALASESNPRREEAVIAAIAIVGRGMILTLYAYLSAPSYHAVVVALVLVTLAQAVSMVRRGPITRTTIPFGGIVGSAGGGGVTGRDRVRHGRVGGQHLDQAADLEDALYGPLRGGQPHIAPGGVAAVPGAHENG
jgi:4-hydroxybenzoate polyprenyltransferase